MDYDKLRSGGIDVVDALNRFSGNEALFEKYLKKFITEKTYDDLEVAMDTLNYPAVMSAVHTLKGITGSIGMTEMYKLSCDMLIACRQEQYSELPSLYEKMKKEHERIVQLISD